MKDLNKYLGDYARFFPDGKYPEDETENSDVILFECINAAGGVEALCAKLESALIHRANVSPEHAREFAVRLRKLASMIIGEDVSTLPTDDAVLRNATQAIYASVVVDHAHNIPALAGYSVFTPKKIYIDRGLKAAHTYPFLVVHEVIEKSLMDELRFDERGYQRTHQVAQRLEEAAAAASGIPWHDYQAGIMVEEIERAYVAPSEHVPIDLDLTPYVDLEERVMVQAIREVQGLPFVAKKIFDGLYHLQFDDSARMALTMLRFQESYESPEFRGQIFSREEFEAWYTSKKGSFSYAEDWGEGFNIPSSALAPFYEKKFQNLTADESALLAFFESERQEKFYIIATAASSAQGTLEHEIAHALFFLDPEYQRQVLSVLTDINTTPLKEFLVATYGDYHQAVLDDEAHAYLLTDRDELARDGFDLTSYSDAIEKLKMIYTSFSK